MVATQINCNVRLVQDVIGKVFFDDIALVAQANHELVEAVTRINFHDVPQNGHPANLYHWLRFNNRFFAQAGAQATGKNDNFHGYEFGKTDRNKEVSNRLYKYRASFYQKR